MPQHKKVAKPVLCARVVRRLSSNKGPGHDYLICVGEGQRAGLIIFNAMDAALAAAAYYCWVTSAGLGGSR